MKKVKSLGLLLSAIMGLSIKGFDRKPINPSTFDQILNRFEKAPLSIINYPKIAYETGFYKDYFIEELKNSRYFNSEIKEVPFNIALDSLINEATKLNSSHNNQPRKTGRTYLKDINNDGNVGVGKESGYYFSLF